MAAAQQALVIEQGATFQISLNFNEPNDANGNPGAPIDVSSWIFHGQIRPTYSSPIVIQNFVFSEGLTTNQILVSITAANTALIPVPPTLNYQITGVLYAYDIFATRPDTTVLKILYGSMTVMPEVTHG
jgi:hypothetical protein